jgi:hypothetical protein
VGDVIVGDFNRDGRLDLVTTGAGVRVLLGNGDGSFLVSPVSFFSGGAVVAADLNGDGFSDLVTMSPGDETVSVLLNAADWGGEPGGPAARQPGSSRTRKEPHAAGDWALAENNGLPATQAVSPGRAAPASLTQAFQTERDEIVDRDRLFANMSRDSCAPLLAQGTRHFDSLDVDELPLESLVRTR